MTTPLACVILAAGQGSRMKSALPKVLHPLAGRPLLHWVLETAQAMDPQKIIVVTAPDGDAVRAAAAPHTTVIQNKPLGTADALKAAMGALAGFKGDVMVLYADGPLYKTETLRGLRASMEKSGAGAAFLAMTVEDPTGYGRMITDDKGFLTRIVEHKDASESERKITLCWTGVMCVRADGAASWLPRIGNKNAKGEYYLTDLPAVAAADGVKTAVAHSPLDETLGANTRAEMAVLERKIQDRLRAAAMENGATLMDPASVYFSWDTKLGSDVVVEPHVFFGPGVRVDNNVTIKAFSHLEGAVIAAGATIGPQARLRPGSDIGPDCKIGNFVEVKNAKLGAGVKASHLAYIGDAAVGDNVNFSCGAITVNYDGVNKHKTTIGADAMIGSNVNLVAPVTIGDGAYVAAGSTITKDVPPGALAVAREKASIIEGWTLKKKKKKD